MYNCLNNFIGIRQLCESGADLPISGLYIDQLEGISIKNLASIESGKYGSAEEMINHLIEDAMKEVFEESKMYFQESFRFNEALDYIYTGEFDDSQYHASEAVEKGLKIRLLNSPMKAVRINSIKVKANTDLEGKEIFVYENGTKTKTITVDLVAGVEQEVFIDLLSQKEHIKIVWETSDLEPADGNTSAFYNFKDCNYCGNQKSRSKYALARGINNNVEDSDTYGILADIVIECCFDKLFCNIVQKLRYPILYKTGIKLLREWLASDRINFVAIHSREWAEAKLDEWEQEDYRNYMKQSTKGLKSFIKRLDGDCFTCNNVSFGYVHP